MLLGRSRRGHACLALFMSCLAGAGMACDAREQRAASAALTRAELVVAANPSAPTRPFPSEPSSSCATLRDVAVSDVVHVERSTLFYADGSEGLVILDVTDAAHPRRAALVPFTGSTVALFVREGIAWVVTTESGTRSAKNGPLTKIRAIDVRDPKQPNVVGEASRAGSAHDVELVGGLLYAMTSAAEDASGTVVESFGIQGTTLRLLERVALSGAPAQLAASSAGLVAVTTTDDAHITLHWLDLSVTRLGSLTHDPQRAVRLPGGIASWERGQRKVVDADDGRRVRLVTCATKSCSPNDSATLRIVDFEAPSPARAVKALRLSEHDGLLTTRFADGVLYVADTPDPRAESTTFRVVETDGKAPRFAGRLSLRGRIQALVPHDDSIVALGIMGSMDTQTKLILHDLDMRKPSAPRARTSVAFGSDWTWSVIADDDAAMTFDPASHLVAVPFTAWRHTDKRYVTGAQLVDLRPFDGQKAAAVPSKGWIERAVFVDGHLVILGPSGVSSIDYAATHHVEHGERTAPLER